MSENCERGPGGNEVCQRRGNMRGGVRSSTSTSTSTTSTSMWSKEGGNLGRAGVDETKNETTSTSTSNLRGSANIAQQPQVEEPVVEIKTPPTQTPNFRSSVIAPTATSTPTATPAAEAVPAVPAVPENKLNLRGSAENAKTVDASTVDQKHGHHHHVHDHSGHHHHDDTDTTIITMLMILRDTTNTSIMTLPIRPRRSSIRRTSDDRVLLATQIRVSLRKKMRRIRVPLPICVEDGLLMIKLAQGKLRESRSTISDELWNSRAVASIALCSWEDV
ncbi:unnamed protein product [Amoebophrya sp. A25]|nr:unnamed protein product [Amoebophrya sp. A25]|eukprot:GSA25T00027120001.1